MKLSEFTVQPPYLPRDIWEQYPDGVIIFPISDELIQKADEQWDCRIRCLNDGTEYLLTLKKSGSLSVVSNLIKQSFAQDGRPVVLRRRRRPNGGGNFVTTYDESCLMDLADPVVVGLWADKNIRPTCVEMADLFKNYVKTLNVGQSVVMRMADALYTWFIEREYAIPDEKREILDRNRARLTAEQAKDGDSCAA